MIADSLRKQLSFWIDSIDPEMGALRTHDTSIKAGSGSLQVGRGGDQQIVAMVPADGIKGSWPVHGGISLAIQRLRSQNGQSENQLVLSCRRGHLEGAFLDLLAVLAGSFVESPTTATTTMAQQYMRWRELFSAEERPRLKGATVLGLTGELLVLRQLVGVVGPQALDWWFGPDLRRHDFVHPARHGLEVKATTALGVDRLRIHGIEQLEVGSRGTLHLAAIRLEPEGSGTSIRSLYEDLLDLGVDALRLRETLAVLGSTPEAGSEAFDIVEQRLFVVDDTFPRIIRSTMIDGTLPVGVSDLTYSIHVGHVPPLAITADVGSAWLSAVGEVPS
jgi:hypothetical protein